MTDPLITLASQIDQCWMERRFGDLAHYLAPDIVLVAPGGVHRIEGIEPAVESYREFMSRSTVHRFRTSHHIITKRGATAVIEYQWDMAWDDRQSAHEAVGREVLVLNNSEGAWRVIWRTQLPA